MSAWSTALAMSPRGRRVLAGVDLAFDQQRPDQRDRRDPGQRQRRRPRGRSARPSGSPRRGAARRRAGRSGRRPRRRRRGRRRRPAPAISQNQSKAGADREGDASPRAAPRSARAAGRRRARQAEKPRPRAATPTRPSTSSPPTSAQLGERLQVERVGVVDRQVDRALLAPRRTRRCRRRGRAPAFRSKASTATRQKSWRPAPESSAKCCSGLSGELDVGARELVPGAAADRDRGADRDDGAGDRGDSLEHAGLRESSQRAPGQRARRAARAVAAPAKRSSARAIPASRISSTVTPWSTVGLVGEVVGEAVVAPGPRAPPAAPRARRSPASPAARGGRARGRSGSRRDDQERQQATARVGEVEGEQTAGIAATESQRSAVQAARRLSQSSIATAIPNIAPFAFQ